MQSCSLQCQIIGVPTDGLMEDDIILTEGQLKLLETNQDLPKDSSHLPPEAAVVKGAVYTWPGGIVPYQLDHSLSEYSKHQHS